MKQLKIVAIISLIATISLLAPTSSHAFELRSDEKASVSESETINTTLYTAGKNIEIKGTINGDLFCAGQTITITGTVNGDVLCAAQTLFINGTVQGDVRAAAQYTTIKGIVQKNTTIFSQGVFLTKESTVNGDILVAAQNVNQEGKINGELYGSVQDLSISGSVSKDVTVEAEKVSLTQGAAISGKLKYTSDNKAEIAKEATVQGGVTQQAPEPRKKQIAKDEQFLGKTWFITKITSILSFAITTLLTVIFFPRFTQKVVTKMKSEPGMTIGWGALVLFATPLIVLFLLFSVIGIAASIALALIWVAALIVSRAFVGMLVGEYILTKYFPTINKTPFTVGLAGTLVCSLVFFIPILGGVASFISILWGLGGLITSIREKGPEQVTTQATTLT